MTYELFSLLFCIQPLALTGSAENGDTKKEREKEETQKIQPKEQTEEEKRKEAFSDLSKKLSWLFFSKNVELERILKKLTKDPNVKLSGGKTHPITFQYFQSCLKWVNEWNNKTLSYPVLPQPSYPGPIGMASFAGEVLSEKVRKYNQFRLCWVRSRKPEDMQQD